jgi:hypothetical protein
LILSPLFQVHKLNPAGIQKGQEIATAFDDLLHKLGTYCERECREFSIVKTKLEEASFYAKKAMAIKPENQG